MRRFAQTRIRTKLTPNLRSFLLEHSCKDDLLIPSPRLILILICCNDLAKSYRPRIPLLYPRYPYLEFRVSIYANPSIFLSKSRFSVLVNERMIGVLVILFAFAQICAKFDLLKVSALLVLLSFLFHHAAAPQY